MKVYGIFTTENFQMETNKKRAYTLARNYNRSDPKAYCEVRVIDNPPLEYRSLDAPAFVELSYFVIRYNGNPGHKNVGDLVRRD